VRHFSFACQSGAPQQLKTAVLPFLGLFAAPGNLLKFPGAVRLNSKNFSFVCRLADYK